MKQKLAKILRSPRWLGLVLVVTLLGGCVAALLAVDTLARWMPSMPPATHRNHATASVAVMGSRMVYQERGAGELTIVILHGMASHSGDFLRLAEALECGRVLLPDRIGYGASSRPEVDYSLDTHRRYLLGFLDELGVESAFIVGHSMGASLAALTSSINPERVTGAALLAPAGPGPIPGFGEHLAAYLGPSRRNRLAFWISDTWFYQWRHPDSLARQSLGTTGSLDESYARALSEVDVPVLLMWGPKDRSFHKRAEYMSRIEDLEFVPAPPDSGHWLLGNDPRWAAEAICELAIRYGPPRALGQPIE